MDRYTNQEEHRDELISDVLLWTPTNGRAKPGRPARTYIQPLCEDTGCSPEDLPEAMNEREKWRDRVRDNHAGGTTWWWWGGRTKPTLISAHMCFSVRLNVCMWVWWLVGVFGISTLVGYFMPNPIYIYIYIYIYKKVNNVATVIEGYTKALFSIATTPRCREGRYFFSWISPLHPW